MGTSHLAALDPDRSSSSGWRTWRDVVLRGAGFPARAVLALADPALSAAADAAAETPTLSGVYLDEYRAACERLTTAIRERARDPRLREAIAWQNPKLVTTCLDKVAAGEPRNVRGRNHETTVASYAQRYALKNDTIGFVGPVGWARWVDDGPAITMTVGPRLLTRRTVYFEIWAIDAVAQALSADPRVRPWIAPRPFAAHRLDGVTLHVPGADPVALSPREAEILSYVDGSRSVRAIADELAWSEFADLGDPKTLLEAIDTMVERSLVRLDLINGVEAFPEQTLLDRLERIANPDARAYAVETVGRLVAARDRVSAAAGDDAALTAALNALGECFEEITGMAGERRAGETYAGRTLVYEDTVRDVRVELGPAIRTELARPLNLLLDSARWLTAEIGAQYHQLFLELYERRAAQLGTDEVPLTAILSLGTPQMYFDPRALAQPVQRAVAEFQRRWAQVLPLDPDADHVEATSADLAERVARQFPPRPVPWATAIYHSPDFMLAAADADAVERGEYQLVLGELHVSFNTLESRVFVQQHDDPPSMLAAAEADLGDRRVYAIASRDLPTVSARVSPPSALLSPRYTYWTTHIESVTPPGPIIPVAEMTVRREGDELVVHSMSGALTAPLSWVLGEQLSGLSVNAFQVWAKAAHTPRITIDRLVVARESWTFAAAELTWAAVKSESERFLAARRWRREHGLPERAFYKVPVEDKPTFVDFRSLVLVNILAKAIRRSARENRGSVTLTEMLPDQPNLWLCDGEGERYTSEFRILVVDHGAPRS